MSKNQKRPTTTTTTEITNLTPTFDLNLDHYNLSDLLTMFKLNTNFTEVELKAAKRIVYQMHPDKSGLDPEFYRFFAKAHRSLEDVLSFSQSRSVGKMGSSSESLNELVEQRKLDYVGSMPALMNEPTSGHSGNRVPTTENRGEFNRNFNKAFEDAHQEYGSMLNPQNGYGSWLKQKETEEEEELTKKGKTSDMERVQYLKEKYRAQQMTLYQEPMEFSGWSSSGSSSSASSSLLSGTSLDEIVGAGSGIEHSSGMFDTLQFQDLKQAYTQTMIPVTDQDFESRKKYRNLDELQQERSRQTLDPLKEIDSMRILSGRRKTEEEEGMARAFRFAQDMEKGMNRNQQFDRRFFLLKN